MADIGSASLSIIPSFKGFESALERGSSGAMTSAGTAGGTTFGNAAGKSAGSRFGGVFKKAATASLVGIGALGVGAFKLAKDSISAASDLEESTNKVQQVFGKGAESVFQFSAKAADALGQTNQAARDAAATFGLFGNLAGLNDKKSAKFATRMTTLASDLASFHNTEPSEAVEALGAALRGEAEPIRSYGVLLDEAALKAEALRLGLLKPVKDATKIKSYQISLIEKQRDLNEAIKEHGEASFEAEKAEAALGTTRELLQKATEGTIPPLTQQQKVLAASSAIFRQTKVAQGDFARTSDGLANQQRRLSARFEDAKAKLGTGLLPIMTDAADFLLDEGIPAFEKFSEWFNEDGIPALKKFGGFLKDDVAPVLKDAAEGAKDLAGFLNDLPKEVKVGGLVGLAALMGASKLRGGKGVLGSAGSALGLAKPVPVLVTNPGFGAGGVGGAGGKAGAAPKVLTLRNVGRLFIAGAVADGIFEATVGDAFGMDPNTAKDPRDELSPTIKHGGGAFGIGLPSPLEQKKEELAAEAAKERWDALVVGARKYKGALDLVGAKKVNPELRIPNILQEQDRLNSLGDKLDLVGSKKIRPGVELAGVERAHRQIDELDGALAGLATGVSDAFDHVGDLATGRRGRGRFAHSRRRNLGGYP